MLENENMLRLDENVEPRATFKYCIVDTLGRITSLFKKLWTLAYCISKLRIE